MAFNLNISESVKTLPNAHQDLSNQPKVSDTDLQKAVHATATPILALSPAIERELKIAKSKAPIDKDPTLTELRKEFRKLIVRSGQFITFSKEGLKKWNEFFRKNNEQPFPPNSYFLRSDNEKDILVIDEESLFVFRFYTPIDNVNRNYEMPREKAEEFLIHLKSKS